MSNFTFESDLILQIKNAMEARVSESPQDKFIHYLSHDLREPARMVSQFLKLVKMRNENSMDKTSGEYLDYAINASKKMDQMIQSLSDISKVNGLSEEKSNVTVKEVVDNILDQQEVLVMLRKAEVELIGENQVVVRKRVFKELLKEFISNSLQHAQRIEALKIRISITQKEDVLHLSVQDNGRPLEEFWRDKAFELFQKKDKNTNNTGIGLTKAKLQVERYHGKIWISVSESKGTIVNCELH